MKKKIPAYFYKDKTIEVAKKLLGAFLVHESPKGKTVGRIIETEAYLHDDPACHASRGKTRRNRVMFGPPGHAYIYFIYGMYYCLNVVTGPPEVGEAVLIRALEPIFGVDLMKKRRPKAKSLHELMNGPAKLMMAMGIPHSLNGASLTRHPLYLMRDIPHAGINSSHSMVVTTRIGISKGGHLPLRFYIKDNLFVSKK